MYNSTQSSHFTSKVVSLVLKEAPENSMDFCLNLQVQVPKMNIQEPPYLRQLGLYNFCITDIHA